MPKLLTQHRRMDLTGSSIVPFTQFQSNWAEFTQGCFDGRLHSASFAFLPLLGCHHSLRLGLDWSNVFVAGGAILGCLSSETSGYKSSDIDLFIYGIRDESAANAKLKEVFFHLSRCFTSA